MHAEYIEPRSIYVSDCHQEKLAAVSTPRADVTLIGNMGTHGTIFGMDSPPVVIQICKMGS